MTIDTTVRPIHSDADFDRSLAEYERCFDATPEPDTEAAYRFEVLGVLLAKFEEARYPLAPDDPVSALTQAVESKGKTQSDLTALLGAPRASDTKRL